MARSAATQLKKMLAERIQKNQKALFDWQMENSRTSPPPFYCSVDLRDSGYKIAPVDSNLFPAGFNNICPADISATAPIIRAQLAAVAARAQLGELKRVLIIPEAHTSNGWYIENLHYLNHILTEAGAETRIGWYGELPAGTSTPFTLTSTTGKTLEAYPLEIRNGEASAAGFVPDMVLLNNDFSSGYPELLDGLRQPVLPSHTLGWHSRKKSTHFLHYNRLAAEFASIVDIDPWIIQIDTEEVGPVNFNEDMGTEEVAQAVDRILKRTQAAYQAHKVTQKPFVFVKNNSGTYGMGIMVVHDAEELRTMNRRTKNKMSVGKNRLPIGSMCVQEGVATATLVDRLPAEPVIYLMGTSLIGGFLRTNPERGVEENLNSQGMVFRKLCMSDLRSAMHVPGFVPEETDDETSSVDEPVLELVYGSIARISALATGREMAEGQEVRRHLAEPARR